jgi:RNA polymerase sigma factor (sigma-70 family)
MKMNGIDLLAEYQTGRSEEAFSELVRRFTNLVYSAARRQLANRALAEEAAQTVFARLAKAAPQLRTEAELAAWLHRTTVHVAIDLWRSETRRQTREQLAAAMEPAPAEPDERWEEIAPFLDHALNQMANGDRQALLLRYFDGRSMRQVGQLLGVTENAAKMRVHRALERLRDGLARQGIACGLPTLASLLASHSIEAAPAQLVITLASPQFLSGVVAGAAGSSMFPIFLLLMSKAKLATAVALLAALGIGMVATYRAINPGEPSSADDGFIAPGFTSPAAMESQANSVPGGTAVSSWPGGGFQNPGLAARDEVRDELRALLDRPPASSSYPPEPLRQALAKFGPDLSEAMPILLEALEADDYETRAWTLSGIHFAIGQQRRTPYAEERALEMFAQAHSALRKLLLSPEEPDLLRRFALQSYFSPLANAHGFPPAPFDPAYAQDLQAALGLSEKGGFGFEVADHLGRHFAQRPFESDLLVPAMLSQLNDPSPQRRFTAAYALATWPGEKPAGLQGILSAELNTKSPDSYRAAMGLGKLGEAALGSVPELLAYAEQTRDWPAGYAHAALEAACRIQPELRERFPEIDAKLRDEEAAMSQGPVSRTITPAELAAALAHPTEGPGLRASLISGLLDAVKFELGQSADSNPEAIREAMLAQFFEGIHPEEATGEQRVAIEEIIAAVRAADLRAAPEEAPPTRSLPMTALVLDARILLVESASAHEAQMEQVLNGFQSHYQSGTGESQVTPERFEELSGMIREMDPVFHAAWRQQIFKTYPWLDRLLPAEDQ